MKQHFFLFEMIMQADDAHIFSRKYRQKYTKGRSQKSDHQIQSPVVFSRDFCTLTWSVGCLPFFKLQSHFFTPASPARRQRGATQMAWKALHTARKPQNSFRAIGCPRLTESKLTCAKMAKVERLSHTHLVRNESTATALQLRADHDPSREDLHKGGEKRHPPASAERRRGCLESWRSSFIKKINKIILKMHLDSVLSGS